MNINKQDIKTDKKGFYTMKEGKPVIEASRLAGFLKEQNFMRISEEGNDAVTIIHNSRKILKPFNYR